jgi:hypothetical protein
MTSAVTPAGWVDGAQPATLHKLCACRGFLHQLGPAHITHICPAIRHTAHQIHLGLHIHSPCLQLCADGWGAMRCGQEGSRKTIWKQPKQGGKNHVQILPFRLKNDLGYPYLVQRKHEIKQGLFAKTILNHLLASMETANPCMAEKYFFFCKIFYFVVYFFTFLPGELSSFPIRFSTHTPLLLR